MTIKTYDDYRIRFDSLKNTFLNILDSPITTTADYNDVTRILNSTKTLFDNYKDTLIIDSGEISNTIADKNRTIKILETENVVLNKMVGNLENGSNAAIGELLDQNLIYNKNLVHNITLGVIMFGGLVFYIKIIK